MVKKIKNENYQPIWKPYLNKEVSIQFSNSSVCGIFCIPNVSEGYAEIKPSLIYAADDEHAYIEKEVPIRFSLKLLEKNEVIIRPLRQGYLEERVDQINANVDKKKGVTGFS